MLHILFLLFLMTFSYSQSRAITAVVADDTNQPLELAIVIAKLRHKKVILKLTVVVSDKIATMSDIVKKMLNNKVDS
ncbi:hypothetical protein [Flavobacterium sp. 14A]|uniref:hypothetical protein n=1 Tax=Flavobacterium sp. 14A TaxID=2735896 RepID=UPI00156F6D70|nr:hypothetical protein [Flavobacterium sp. 14A]NRT11649.1 hypothetical protein [Flavobacterium sp. 14A]